MNISGMRVAITGGAGFIGSHLVDHLIAKGNHVVVIDNFSTGERANLAQHAASHRLQVLECDVRSLEGMERALKDIDVVFHLATHCVRLSLSEPKENHDVNATGTLHTLMAAEKNSVKRFVYCSSSEVYGDEPGRALGRLSEDSPKLPTTVYGATKLVGEHYTLSFHRLQRMSTRVVRPFNTYGPRSYFSGPSGEVIPRFSYLLRAGKTPVIFGDGSQTRDFTYVTDTARGICLAGESDELAGSSVNLACGNAVSIKDLGDILCRLHGKTFEPRVFGPRPGDIQSLGADISLAKKILGWKAEYNIEEGLKKYLWWLDEKDIDYAEAIKSIAIKNWIPNAEQSETSNAYSSLSA